jgi:uncharacterized protein with HEPN domain
MRNDDELFLDMLLSARKSVAFANGITWESFTQSDIHQSAIIREIQVIGDAVRLLSDEAKVQHPQIDWSEIVGMRNRLVHEYFSINLKTVWETVVGDIPGLISALESIVPPNTDDELG